MFKEFQKIHRLQREVIVTEKIDGTNACVVVQEDGTVSAQSRNRIITPEDDNFGFARWVKRHEEDLRTLGPGYHYGEWWGVGLQRGYDLSERRFSLFNVSRWKDSHDRPKCCHVVPLLGTIMGFDGVWDIVEELGFGGSRASPGYMKPEGIVLYHTQSRSLFKYTLDDNDSHKGNKNNDDVLGHSGTINRNVEAVRIPLQAA